MLSKGLLNLNIIICLFQNKIIFDKIECFSTFYLSGFVICAQQLLMLVTPHQMGFL